MTTNNNYFLPKDTFQTIDFKKSESDNFSLMFNKTAYFEDDKFIFYKRDRYGKETIDLAGKFNSMASRYPFIKPIHKRHKDSISKLLGANNTASSIFSPDWRLIIGIGHESVYEVSITLHHIYGTPYIPGQAVKGVTRSWIITEAFEQDEKKALRDKLFCRIFGSPKDSAIGEHQGSVIFFDAFPTVAPKLKVDIMNPHYVDYYRGDKQPADYLNPVPIPFLTVNATPFEFITGMKKTLTADKDSPLVQKANGLNKASTCVNVVQYWLKKALAEHGIGAKTAVGYGYMALAKTNGEKL